MAIANYQWKAALLHCQLLFKSETGEHCFRC